MDDPNRIVSASRRPKALIRLLDSQQIEVKTLFSLLETNLFEIQVVLHSRLSVEDVLRLVAEKVDLSFPDSQYFCLGFSDNL